MTAIQRYVAFLRGINVGGHKKVSMADLQKYFIDAGYQNVRTVLNSGNVIFSTEQKVSEQQVEEMLEKVLGYHVDVILRSRSEIEKFIVSAPFKDIAVTPQTRLYVTFLQEKAVSTLKLPYESPEKDFVILSDEKRDVVSVLTLSPDRGTTESMNILEKEYGKHVTTRNWNTILKIAEIIK